MADCAKVTYPTRQLARLALTKLAAKQRSAGSSKTVRNLYHCQLCGGWHLSSSKRGGSGRRVA